MSDLNNDGYDDFSVMYSDVESGSSGDRVIYQYLGASSSDSIIASVDTLTKGFYTDFYQTGNVFGEESSFMLYNEYLDYIDIFSIDSSHIIYRFNNAQENTQSYGDINNDGYDDWIILFPTPELYQGFYGNISFDTIADFVLPVENKPQLIFRQYLNSAFIGNVCGDGYDKLLIIETDKRFPVSNDDADYFYHVYCYSYNEVETGTEPQTLVEFTLYQNYPNPFNPTTTIQYATRDNSKVKLSVYDINGHLVEVLVDEYHQVGAYNVKWDASKYSSGIYIYRLESNLGIYSKKMVLIK
jgi:hypothetical protein